MNVLDTVTRMIENWPSLYKNRADALKHVFTSPHWKWVDGELVAEDDSELTRDPQYCQLHREPEEGADLYEVLRISKENAIIDWTIANAKLLAREIMSSATHNCLWLPESYNRFNDMPEDVNEDWKAAAMDTARGLFYSTKDAKKGSHEFNAHRALMPFLRKHGLISDDMVEKRIAALEAEIAALKGE